MAHQNHQNQPFYLLTVEYHHQNQLTDSLPRVLFSGYILKTILKIKGKQMYSQPQELYYHLRLALVLWLIRLWMQPE